MPSMPIWLSQTSIGNGKRSPAALLTPLHTPMSSAGAYARMPMIWKTKKDTRKGER